MIEHINQLYQPKLLDGLKPVSHKAHENARLENKLHSAKALLMVTELAEKAGIELTGGDELTRQAVELVKIDEQHNTFGRAVNKYEQREANFQQGKITEKVQRFFSGNPVDPRAQGQAPAQPQYVVVNQDDTLRTQVEQLAQSVHTLASAFSGAAQPQPQVQQQPQPQMQGSAYQQQPQFAQQPTPQASGDGSGINWNI